MATGRIRRKALQEVLDAVHGPSPADLVCPLCDRPVPVRERDAHHVVPKSKGGRETVVLHRICHRQVHALFSETELARDYATPDALRAHPDMARFLEWVRGKPPAFFERTRRSVRRR